MRLCGPDLVREPSVCTFGRINVLLVVHEKRAEVRMSIGIVGLLAQLRLMVVVCRRASGASKLDKTARPWSEVRVEKVSESRSRETQRQRLIPSPVRAIASLPRISHVRSETSRADKARVRRELPVRFCRCRVHVVGLRVARSEGSEAAARGSGESAFLPETKVPV